MKKLGFLLLGIMLLVSSGCKKEDNSFWNGMVEFTLVNNTNEATHLFTADESFDSSNKVDAWQNRKVTVQLKATDKPGEYEERILTIFAGRNGNIIITRTYTLNKDNREIMVKFENNDLM